MKAFLSLIVLFVIPLSASAYIPDKAITFPSEQLAVGNILIASENIKSGIFAKSVILLIDHDQNGDMGLIINKPSRYQVKEVYSGFVLADRAGRLFIGGPVMNAALSVLLKREDDGEGMTGILPHIFHSFVSNNDAADRYFSAAVEAVRFYSGYAGWGKGQLADEINRGGWHIIDGDPADVFDLDTETMWQELMQRVRGR